MKIKIKKKDAENTIFKGARTLKLVVPCQNESGNNELVYKEIMCYEMFEKLSKIHLKTTRNKMFTFPSNIFQPLVIILACLIIVVSKMPQRKYRKTILFLAIGSLTLIIFLGIFGFFN